MKRSSYLSGLYPTKRKKRSSDADEAGQGASLPRFTEASAPYGIEDVPREIWGVVFSLAAVPNREYRSVQFVSKWFYNVYWDCMSAFVFNQESTAVVHNALMTCRREALFTLELYHCPIARINRYFARMRNLKSLVVRTDQFRSRGPGLSNLTLLPSLTSLDLNCLAFSENQTNHKLDIIAQLTQLTSLSLSGCAIVDNDGLALVCSLSNLKRLSLDLSRGFFTDPGLAALQRLTRLTHLSLSFFSSNTRITDVGVNFLTSLTQLQALHLSHASVSDFSAQALAEVLRDLEELSFSDCTQITGAGLQGFHALKKLDLGGTAFHDDNIAAIAANTDLELLDVSTCPGITDAGLQKILSSFTRLRGLCVANCRRVKLDSKLLARKCKSLHDFVEPAYPKLATSKVAKLFRSKLRGEERVVLPSGRAYTVNYDLPTHEWFRREMDEDVLLGSNGSNNGQVSNSPLTLPPKEKLERQASLTGNGANIGLLVGGAGVNGGGGGGGSNSDKQIMLLLQQQQEQKELQTTTTTIITTKPGRVPSPKPALPPTVLLFEKEKDVKEVQVDMMEIEVPPKRVASERRRLTSFQQLQQQHPQQQQQQQQQIQFPLSQELADPSSSPKWRSSSRLKSDEKL